LSGWPLARDIFFQETVSEISDSRRGPAFLLSADGISAAIDLAFEPLGLVAGRRR
jgi:hypothetical protein